MSGGEPARPAGLLVVAACLLAVVVASAAVPVATPGGGGAGGSGGQATTGGSGSGGGGVGIGDILRWLLGDGTQRSVPPEYDVTVQPEPVPGRTVTVTVRRQGGPVEGALVSFGGRRVGRTGADGRVRGRVPYGDDELVVRVTPPGERVTAAPRGGALAAVGPGGVRQSEPPTPANITERYELPTTAAVRVEGTTDPGSTVRVVASVAGESLSRAAVSVNGRRVGETDATGTAGVRVPDDGSRRLRIRVERGVVEGERTVPVRILTVAVRPVDPLAVPTRPAVVETRLGDTPVANATLSLDGEPVGRTDATGRARLTLPADPTATVVAQSGERVARQSLLLAYAATLGAVAVPAALLAGLLALGVRARTQVASGVARAGGGVLALVGLAGRLAVLLAVAAGRVGRTGRRLLGWAAGLPPRLVAWRPLARLGAGSLWLAGLPARLLDDGDATEPVARRGGATGREASSEPGGEFERLWVEFARSVAPEDWRRRSPAEVGRAAVERGLPAEAVDRVTRAQRERTYARDGPSPGERDRAVEALRALIAERDTGEREP